MRCLHCHTDGVPTAVTICPKCGIHLPTLMRDVLPLGTSLRSGTYRIDYPLGRGGFGITYRAVHSSLEQIIAIKEFFPQEHVFRDSSSPRLIIPNTQRDHYQRSLRRFIREGKILAGINHRNVVRVHDLFEEHDTAYIVMELLAGQTLRDELDALPDRRMAPERVYDIVSHLVEALATIHDADVYHLDIKPENVMICQDSRIVLVDFGAARQGFSSRSTQAFTVGYAAPEVLAGRDVGPESDVFELGMMTYELLTGKLPPNALQRLTAEDTWTVDSVPSLWEMPIYGALRMPREERPSIRTWWRWVSGTPESSATIAIDAIDPDVRFFLTSLLDEAEMTNLPADTRDAMIIDLNQRLDSLVMDRLIDKLTGRQVAEFEKMIERGGTPADAQQFFIQTVPDFQQICTQALEDFFEAYTGKPVTES